jgi:hypothetical protein
LPDEYAYAKAKIYPLNPVPILTHNWTSSGGLGVASVTVRVSNLGTATAQGVYVFAGFDAGNERVWNGTRSPAFSVGPDEKVTATLNVRVPYGEHTRILVQIVLDGVAVDESYSKWMDL